MSTLAYTAHQISNEWPSLVDPLPKALAAAIAVFDEAGYAEGPYAAVDADKLTTKNVAQAITDLADVLAAEAQFADAKARVVHELARAVVRAASDSVPEVLDRIRPAFERAVSEYTEAVGALPDTITSDTLVAAGPSVLDAYQRATAAAIEIGKADAWLASLVNLPAFAGRDNEPLLRVLAPAGRRDLRVLADAAHAANPDPYLYRLNPLYLTAVREGVEFELHTPVDVAAILARIEAAPAERRRQRGVRLR